MAKGKRYFSGASNSKKSGKRGKLDKSASRGHPDPDSSDFYNDEVDQFHEEREKIPLDRVRRRLPAPVDEEVYRIRSDDEEEESEDNEEEDEDADNDEDLKDMESDISDKDDSEGYLPSADAWGKRRKDYYSADVAGDEGGALSGSDVEAAELEEREAISLQKRLVQQMTEDDFKLDSAGSTALVKPSETREKEIVATDLSALTEEEKLELLRQQSPELLPLIEEYQTKAQLQKDQMEPIANALLSFEYDKSNHHAKSIFNWIISKNELYMNYLVNLQFYFILKATRQAIDNHPVIDRIVELKKLVEKFDAQHEENDIYLKRFSKIVKAGASVDDLLQLVGTMTPRGGRKRHMRKEQGKDNEKGKSKEIKQKKKVHWNLDQESENLGENSVNGDQAVEQEDIGKRGVTYEIERNKGLTPHRKKEQRNPRVKNRLRFKKAVHRKRSQLPDARKELQRYGGEVRGIKANVVRSVKLH